MPLLTISGTAHWVRYPSDFVWINAANKAALFPADPDPIDNWPLAVVLQLVVTAPNGLWLVDLKASYFDISVGNGNLSTSCKAVQIDRTGWVGLRVLALSTPPTDPQLAYSADATVVKIKYSKLTGSQMFAVTN